MLLSAVNTRTRVATAAYFWVLALITTAAFVPRVAAEPSNSTGISIPNTTNSTNTIVNIGILQPDLASVLGNKTAASVMGGIVAIRMAIDTINAKGVVPGATFRFISENTSPTDPATTIFAATSILSDNVTAVISNISPNMTSVVALLASKFKIPQCSFGYNSLAQKAMFPYLFRTDTSGKLLCDAVLIFVGTQKWPNIVILFNGDSESAHLATYLETKARNSTLFKNIILSQTLYNETNNSTDLGELPESLAYLTGAVMVLIGKPEQQVASLQAAKAHNLIDHNHVFIALGAYEINEIFRSLPNDSRVSVRDFDGLIMVDTPWNLTGLPAYDDFLAEYRTQPNSSFGGRVDPADLSYRQPKAYSCMMMIAYGINQALNNYPNGRSAGLDDLGNIATGVFLKTANMTQLTFNTGWTGPAGFMEVDRNGELTVGNHQFYFLQNGSAVFFAMHWGNDSNLTIITPPVYFGGSTQAPVFEPIICPNPSYTDPGGVFMVSVAGFWMACSFIVMIAVIWNRNVREIRASSPLFACIELIGLMMAYATVLIEVAKPTTAICILRPTLAIFAYVLVLGGIIAKNFRIYRVFRNKYALQTAIRDSQLMRMVTSILFIVMVPYLVWMIADPPRPTVSFQSGFRVCASGYRIPGLETSPFLFAIFIYCLGLGVWAGYLAYKTRRVGKQWSESRTIGYVTYNLTFCAALAAPLYFVSSIESLASFYMYNSVVMFAATFTLFILFLPSMMHLVNPPKKSSSSKRMDEGRSHSRARFTELNEPSEPTVQAYEGELAVRTRRKLWPDLSPWKMKKVVLVPSKKLLILVDSSTRKIESCQYYSCDPVVSDNSTEEHVFRVSGQDWYNDILFQVKNSQELERWCRWFRGTLPYFVSSEGERVTSQDLPPVPGIPPALLKEGKLNNGTFGDGFMEDATVNTAITPTPNIGNDIGTTFAGGGRCASVDGDTVSDIGGDTGPSVATSMRRNPFSFGHQPRREEQELEPVQETFTVEDDNESQSGLRSQNKQKHFSFTWSLSP